MAVVTIFGGSHAKEGDAEYETARRLGRLLAESGHTVCNGGYGGVMEASARGAKEAGGKTIGITTEEFGGPANHWIDKEIRVKKWGERLFQLIETGDAYVVLDGGTGTLVELFVVWEMSNKNFFSKPFVLLGPQFQSLTQNVLKMRQVIRNANLVFAQSAEEAIKLFKGKT
jgi:uncharacterized protein (TIGR00725 family)